MRSYHLLKRSALHLSGQRPIKMTGCMFGISPAALSPIDGLMKPRTVHFSSSGGGKDGKDTVAKKPLRPPLDGNKQPKIRGKFRHQSNQKENFDEKVLRPASEGKLSKKHSSGIPHLAGRKHKASLTPRSARGRQNTGFFAIPEDEPDVEYLDEEDDEEFMGGGETQIKMFASLSSTESHKSSAIKMMSRRPEHNFLQMDDDDEVDDYYASELIDDDKYFWREEEYEPLGVGFDDDDLANEDGIIELEYQKSDAVASTNLFGSFDDLSDGDGASEDDFVSKGPQRVTSGRSEPWELRDPESSFFLDQNDVFELAMLEEKDLARKADPALDRLVLPLQDHGPELDDFLEAMADHPSDYAHIASHSPHSESLREPKPLYPKKRMNPSLEFVESYARFLYVSGLPPLELDGELVRDLDNPLQRDLLKKTIARLANVNSDQVFPATTSSAFVGFDSPKALAQALEMGATESTILNMPGIAMYKGGTDSDTPFPKTTPDCIVELTNIPPGNTPSSLMRVLLPVGSEVEAAYGDMTTGNFHFLSSTHVLIRFHSKEQAESAVDSVGLRERLKVLGQYPVRYFRARRELVHAGFEGPNQAYEKRSMGPRLIVDGDMPSKKFFLSHARLIQLEGLDLEVTKEEVSAAFQPFCSRRRDVHGSVEFVTCSAGLRTNIAYVGFDSPGEAEQAVDALSGVVKLGDKRAILRLVRDRRIPGRAPAEPEKRPERPVEELLDDLDNWEKYVNPEDLELLEKAGVSKVALDEALRGIRYSNPTFGALDSSLRSEALEPEKMRGQQYKELVEMYIETLKECLATPDDVGLMYEAIHNPGEKIDLSIFEEEKVRQKKLLEKRNV